MWFPLKATGYAGNVGSLLSVCELPQTAITLFSHSPLAIELGFDQLHCNYTSALSFYPSFSLLSTFVKKKLSLMSATYRRRLKPHLSLIDSTTISFQQELTKSPANPGTPLSNYSPFQLQGFTSFAYIIIGDV